MPSNAASSHPGKRLIFLSAATGAGPERKPGGGEFFAIELLSELAHRGWHITLVCPQKGPLFEHAALTGRVAFEPVDLSVTIARLRFARVLMHWMVISHRHRSSLFYGNGFITMKWLAVAAVLWRSRTFCHLHEPAEGALHYAAARSRSIARHIYRFFAISDSVRDSFVRASGVSDDRVLRIYNGVPVAPVPPIENATECQTLRREVGLPEQSLLVLMVARMEHTKGHETFVRAARIVHDEIPNVAFALLGFEAGSRVEREEFERVSEIIEQERAGDYVHRITFRADARHFMRCANLVVVPSLQEGFGRTAVEAMAEQTPVIASRVGGLQEIITDGVDGWLVEPGDAQLLATRIASVLSDPATARRACANGYLTVRERFSITRMVEQIEAALQQ